MQITSNKLEAFMKSGIIIYELEDYLFKLLKFRLSSFFPDGYIVRGTSIELTNDSVPLADKFHVIYNPLEFLPEQIQMFISKLQGHISLIPLYEEHNDGYYETIDCKQLYNMIMTAEYDLTKGSEFTNNPIDAADNGKTVVLIPFSYISEREHLIKSELSSLKDSRMCLRLDLMSGIRMPDTFSSYGQEKGNLSEILDLSLKGTIKSENFLQFATPDNLGFMTVGKPNNSDDVFDYDLTTITRLIKRAKELNFDKSYPINVLIVAEGFRIRELEVIASLADELHILLPERLYQDNLGFKEEIGRITRSLKPDKSLCIHYIENLKTEIKYETQPI